MLARLGTLDNVRYKRRHTFVSQVISEPTNRGLEWFNPTSNLWSAVCPTNGIGSCFSTSFFHETLIKLKTYWWTPTCPQVKYKIKYQHSLIFYLRICKKSTVILKLIDNLIVSPDRSILSMASSANWFDYDISKLPDWNSDCVCAISDGMISVECRHTNFNSYLQTYDRQYK
jgi:hypothetical protein